MGRWEKGEKVTEIVDDFAWQIGSGRGREMAGRERIKVYEPVPVW